MADSTLTSPKASPKELGVSLVLPEGLSQGKRLAKILEDEGLQLLNLVSSEETGEIYQKAGSTTWKIIKKVFWIVAFSLLMAGALVFWIWGIGFQLGFWLRERLMGRPPASIFDVVSGISSFVAKAIIRTYNGAAALVQNTLGWRFNLPVIAGAVVAEEVVAKPSESAAAGTGNGSDGTATDAGESD